jgi:signal peptidase I
MHGSAEASGSRRARRGAAAGLAWARLLAILLPLALVLLAASKGRVLRVSAEDMAPTLLPGDWVYVLDGFWDSREPRRGELAALALAADGVRRQPADRAPGLPVVVEVARIIGVPGDRIEIRADLLRISGARVRDELLPNTFTDADGRSFRLYLESLEADSESRWSSFAVTRDRERPQAELREAQVEAGRYLALGDHRSRAYDGRYWGSVRRADLVGLPLAVLFSRDPRSGAVRWRRLGTLLGP